MSVQTCLLLDNLVQFDIRSYAPLTLAQFSDVHNDKSQAGHLSFFTKVKDLRSNKKLHILTSLIQPIMELKQVV